MPADRPRPTLADYVAITFSPALIMGLVGSLVFFLVEILYAGNYEGRMQWILFFFVFAIVLISRIAMETAIADRAPLYGCVLGLLVWLSLCKFVTFPAGLESLSWIINAVLIALVWWSAHRLTWSCTLIDEKAESTGTGLLQAAGLEHVQQDEERKTEDGEQEEEASWWEKYRRYREERKQRHTPGLWVVYYSLVALPLFGLGQYLIPVADVSRRRYVFWLMALYTGSALGLLVTTAFLGLRRYLRQRQLQMPRAVTTAWLVIGGALIAAFLILGALLPRPGAEYGLLRQSPSVSKGRDASRYAMTGGDTGRGEGRPGTRQVDDKKGAATDSNQGKATGRGEKPDKGDQGKTTGQGESQQKGNQDKTTGQGESRPKGEQSDPKENQGRSGEKDPGSSAGTRRGEHKTSGDKGDKESQSRSESPPTSSPAQLPAGLEKAASLLRWIVFALLAAGLLFFLLRGGLRYLANFLDWARRLLDALRAFWDGLFSRPQIEKEEEEQAESLPAEPQPFLSFHNPFRDGSAEGRSLEELAHYSFEALEAWAWEHELARWAGETPLEYAGRIGEEVPALAGEAMRLAAFYARVLYARGPLPSNGRIVLEQFWEQLERVAEQPLSAGGGHQ
jgi:hypothetical protein